MFAHLSRALRPAALLRNTILGLSLAAFAFAATTLAAGQSIGIRPLRTEVEMNPGESRTVTVNVINRSEEDMLAKPLFESYISNDPEGYPIDGTEESDDPQNVLNWLTYNTEAITVPAMGETPVDVTITVPENAEPGGRYAAVFYEPTFDEEEIDGVRIRARVASIIIVRVAGDVNEEGDVIDFSLDKEELASDLPLNFVVGFQNTGSIHLKPTGKIYLRDAEGNRITSVGRIVDPNNTDKEIVVDYLPLNAPKGNVLPGSMRNFISTWEEPTSFTGLTADLELTYGSDRKEIRRTLPIDLNNSATITDAKFNTDTKEFTFTVTNTGSLNIKPDMTVGIVNSMDFQVDSLEYTADTYLLPEESLDITVAWEKEIPSGSYTANIEFASPVLSDFVAQCKFQYGSLFASILNGDTIAIVLIFLGVILLGGVFYTLGRRKQTAPAAPATDHSAEEK